MRQVEHVARNGDRRGAYRVLVGRPEGKIPLGRRRRRWEYNIKKVSLRNVMDSPWTEIYLALERGYVAVMNIPSP